MVPVSSIILIILYLIQSTNAYITVTVPNVKIQLFPIVFNYEGQKVLLTTQGAFNITNSSNTYSLISAFDIFDTRFHIDIAIDKIYRLYDSQQQVYYYFPNIQGKAYIKYPHQEPIAIEYSKATSRIISGLFGTGHSFATIARSYNKNLIDYWQGTIYAFNLEKGIKINQNSITYQRTKQNIFFCQYIEEFDGIYCIYDPGNGDLFVRRFVSNEDTNYFTDSQFIIPMNYPVGGLKFANYGGQLCAFIWFDMNTPISPVHLSITKDGVAGGYTMFSNLICEDLNSLEVVNLKEIRMIIVCCYNGRLSECELFDENIIPVSSPLSQLFEIGELRVALKYENDKPLLTFVGTDIINTSIVYYIETTIFDCKDAEYEVLPDTEIIVNIWDVVFPNPLDWNENSGFYFYNVYQAFGNFFEINDNGKLVGEVLYSNEKYLYKRIKFIPNGVGTTSISFRGFINVFAYFHLPTKICNLVFKSSCYTSCDTCSNIGNEEDHMCDSCKASSYFMEGTNNCYKERPSNYYLDSSTFTFRKCPLHCDYCENKDKCITCESNYEFLYELTGNSEDTICVEQCITSKYKWYIKTNNGIKSLVCLNGEQRACPLTHKCLNEQTNECIKWEANNILCNPSIPIEGNTTTIVDYLVEDIVGYYKESFIHVDKNQTVVVYDTSQSPNDKFGYDNLTSVQLGECEQKLKEENNIPLNEKLIIAQIDNANPSSPGISLSLLVFTSNGTLLNLSACANIKIVVIIHSSNKPSTLVSKQQLNMYQTENINVFDSQDPFFNDRCTQYSTLKDGKMKDVPLHDRRNQFFSSVSFCEESGCELESTNDENGQIDCLCSIEQNNSSSGGGMLSFSNEKQENKKLWKSISSINIDVLYCANLVFNKEILIKNIGFFIMTSILILQIINYILYFCVKENIFGKFIMNDSTINNHPKWNPPIKEGEKNSNGSNQDKTKNLKLVQMSSSTTHNIRFINEKNEWNICDRNSLSLEDKSHHNKVLDIIPLHQAVNYDKRSFCGLYMFRLKRSHPVYLMVQQKGEYYFRNIIISLFIFQISSNFFLNALFYTDYYVSLDYNSEYHVIQEIPKSVYTMIIGLILNIICGIFGRRELKFPKDMKGVFRYNNNDKGNLKETKIVRHFHTIYFIIIFVLSCFYWYYVSSFCAVYQYSQINWLIGAVISIGLSLICPFIICLISVFFRRRAIKIRNERMFHFSKVVEAMH